MVKVCQCCGHPVPEFDTLRGLTPGQQKIFDALDNAGQRGLTRRQLFDRLYGDDPNGGPDSIGVLNVQRAKMRDTLAAHGMQIVTTQNHYWRMEKIG